MKRVWSEHECDQLQTRLMIGDYTAVIPAAGRGTRLGYSAPKILFPILDRPILAWLIDALSPVCTRFVIIVSPSGREEIANAVDCLSVPVKLAVQKQPTGMGDAVLCAEPLVNTPSCLIVWGDQITIHQRTVGRCAALHGSRAGAKLTFPSIIKNQPYTHIERDASDRVTNVLQARERPIPYDHGESDTGLFIFNTEALFATLRIVRTNGLGCGAQTGEFNLLPALPYFETGPDAVRTLRISDEGETIGVNTTEEVCIVEDILRARR
jgi:bifunctional UDP-N-acetylglucosamine pyrophosphorylase/glucosamine-1-phosphate N-acetyltransferase